MEECRFGSEFRSIQTTAPVGASHGKSKYLIPSCLKSRNLTSIDYVSLVKTAVSSIVLLVDFSDLLICCRNIDLLKKHKGTVRLRRFFNEIMLENRAPMSESPQIFSYGSGNTYSRRLCPQHVPGWSEWSSTRRFVSKCTVMTLFLEMLSYRNDDFGPELVSIPGFRYY